MSKDKKRFCKYCGNEIDPKEKVCTGCGKKFFNIKVFFSKITIIILLICLLVSVASNIIFIKRISEYQAEIVNLSEELFKVEANLKTKETSLNTLHDSYKKLESEKKNTFKEFLEATYLLGDYQNDFAYVTSAGSKYHKRDCTFIKSATSTIYCGTIIDLTRQGYKACSECY